MIQFLSIFGTGRHSSIATVISLSIVFNRSVLFCFVLFLQFHVCDIVLIEYYIIVAV